MAGLKFKKITVELITGKPGETTIHTVKTLEMGWYRFRNLKMGDLLVDSKAGKKWRVTGFATKYRKTKMKGRTVLSEKWFYRIVVRDATENKVIRL
jgi:hypothetical protein